MKVQRRVHHTPASNNRITSVSVRKGAYLHALEIADKNCAIEGHVHGIHMIQLSELGDERAVCFEHLHSVVYPIANEHVARAVQ